MTLLDQVTERQCQHCGQPFTPREGNGGSTQRFCSAKCRKGSQRPQRPQRPPNVAPASAGQVGTGTDLPPLAVEPYESPDRDEFDWADERLVVLPEQPETAIYFNSKGSLVIRQQRPFDDDPFIVISATNIAEFLDKLTEVCGVPEMGRDGKL
jgi:hypothetical protein